MVIYFGFDNVIMPIYVLMEPILLCIFRRVDEFYGFTYTPNGNEITPIHMFLRQGEPHDKNGV